MKLLKNVLLICFTLGFTLRAQNESIQLVFTSNFSAPFQQGKPWANVNENLVKTFIIDRVVADYAQFGISVSTTSGSIVAYIGVHSDYIYGFGEADGFGTYITTLAECDIFSGNFSYHPEWTGSNALVERIGEAISGSVSHEIAHTLNCYHAYMFELFDPTKTGALRDDYLPNEPEDLPENITRDGGGHDIMATRNYITFLERATYNRDFSVHSLRTINFANSGSCNVDGNMTWGISNKTFNQQTDITIATGTTLYIAGYWYTHNLNSKSIYGGTI